MFELATLYLLSIWPEHQKTRRKRKFNEAVLSTLIRHCQIFENVNLILSIGSDNEKELKVTLKFTLAKVSSN